jgi:hypothetical protein
LVNSRKTMLHVVLSPTTVCGCGVLGSCTVYRRVLPSLITLLHTRLHPCLGRGGGSSASSGWTEVITFSWPTKPFKDLLTASESRQAKRDRHCRQLAKRDRHWCQLAKQNSHWCQQTEGTGAILTSIQSNRRGCSSIRPKLQVDG